MNGFRKTIILMKGRYYVNEKISVIMSVYNNADTVEKAIESILAQTYPYWVMIICDDGSSDRTYDIISSYQQQYPERFILLRNETNKKMPYSLNRCLECVETEFVARMDGDDWSTPDRFEKQIAFLRSNPEYDLVGTGITVFDGEKRIASIIRTPVPTRETMLHENAFSHATIMTYKRVYDELGGYSLNPSAVRVEDVDLWCRFLAKGFRGYNLEDELYVILENADAAKRRTFKARLNNAITRRRGYQLLGFSALKCIMPYVQLLYAFIPTPIYRIIHTQRLRRNRRST